MNSVDLDDYLERTVRFEGISIPPQACRDDDGPTLMVPPPAMAVLAAKSARSTSRRSAYSGYPPADALRAPSDDPAMRNAVIGIWTVAAFLFATLGMLIK